MSKGNDKRDHDDGDPSRGRKNHPVTIRVNRKAVTLPDDHVTGFQIKVAAKVPETFKLFDPDGDEVPNDKVIHIHADERFTAISGQDVS